jgi:hypothetical protein
VFFDLSNLELAVYQLAPLCLGYCERDVRQLVPGLGQKFSTLLSAGSKAGGDFISYCSFGSTDMLANGEVIQRSGGAILSAKLSRPLLRYVL